MNNWERLKLKSREEVYPVIYNELLKNQKTIVGKGFSKEVMITRGDGGIILRAK